mmetsp:Transcript_1912/g.2530  ORF Transcript_1912/g.2530 Transcript_1912/m.2530 type:complete len:377 (-) Transcript_1912:80-1210(-)
MAYSVESSRPNTQVRTERQRYEEYRSRHFLTELPASLAGVQKREMSVRELEDRFHQQVAAHTRRDDQRYQEMLQLFKTHSRGGQDGMMVLCVDDFHTVLNVLRVFASRKQAAMLFRKYDRSGTGQMKLHEFITACRPQDFNIDFAPEHMTTVVQEARRGKKMYRDTTLFGTPVRAVTPTQDRMLKNIYSDVKEKCRLRAGPGLTHSNFRARKELLRLFTNFDPHLTGCCPEHKLKFVLDEINYPTGTKNRQKLLDDNRGPTGLDYTRFANKVYPPAEDQNVSASLHNPARDMIQQFLAQQGNGRSFASRNATPPMRNSGAMTSRAGSRAAGRTALAASGAMTARVPAKQHPADLVWSDSKFPPNFLEDYHATITPR